MTTTATKTTKWVGRKPWGTNSATFCTIHIHSNRLKRKDLALVTKWLSSTKEELSKWWWANKTSIMCSNMLVAIPQLTINNISKQVTAVNLRGQVSLWCKTNRSSAARPLTNTTIPRLLSCTPVNSMTSSWLRAKKKTIKMTKMMSKAWKTTEMRHWRISHRMLTSSATSKHQRDK